MYVGQVHLRYVFCILELCTLRECYEYGMATTKRSFDKTYEFIGIAFIQFSLKKTQRGIEGGDWEGEIEEEKGFEFKKKEAWKEEKQGREGERE